MGISYDSFHKETSGQVKLIKESNFTYGSLIGNLNKYLKRRMRVVDIGCGAGTLDFYISDKVKGVYGVDISKNAVKMANQSAKNMSIHNVAFDVCDFPNKVLKGMYDFVIFTEVIEHLEDDKKALTEINKLLNKDGILFLSTPSLNAPLHKIGYAKDFDKRVGHLRRYTVEGLSKMIEDSGFKILESEKTEGIIRNFLFLSPTAGKLVRFVNRFGSGIVTAIDNLTIPIFGESNIIIVAKKI